MVRLRWYWLLAIFGGIGLVASWIMISFHKTSVFILVLLAPFVVILFPLALTELVRTSRALVGSFTWYHWLWFFLFLSGLVWRIRDVQSTQQNPLDPAALFRVGIEFVIFMALAIRLALRKTEWVGSLFRGLVGLLALYALMCVASTVWSAFPAWTAFKSLEYLLDVILLAAVLASIDSLEKYKDFLDWTWTLYGLAIVSVWVGVLILPEVALKPVPGIFHFQIKGAMPNISADSVGELGAILGIIAFARLLLKRGGLHNRVWYSLLFFLGCATMFLAQARTAIVAFGFSIMLILFLSRRWAMAAFLTFTGILAALPLALSGWLWAYMQRGETQEQLSSLSSRVEWWSFAWDKFSQQPWIGYGAYAAGRFVVMAGLQMGKTSTVHSDWVEILVGTGLWGLIPAVLSLFGTWWVLASLFRNSSSEPEEKRLTIEAIAMLALLTVRSFFNNNCFWHAPLAFLVLVGYAEFMRRRQQQRPELPMEPEFVEVGTGR